VGGVTAHVLHLYTDFVCPFCFIAEQSTVPRLLSEFELELDWCGFELHPGTPVGGRPLSTLFPGRDLDALHAQAKQFGAGFGVTDWTPPNWLRNSRRALALAEVARSEGRLEALRHAVFDAHWRTGEDIEATSTLERLASAAGLEPQRALTVADAAETLQRVDERQAMASRAGVSGIPTFRIGEQRVVGCQPYAALAQAAERAGVPRTNPAA
jgi:predicted DsbA family dithiol-disulfide isomerase